MLSIIFFNLETEHLLLKDKYPSYFQRHSKNYGTSEKKILEFLDKENKIKDRY